MEEPDCMSILESTYYPMTTANQLYNLICKTIAEDAEKKNNHKESNPIIISQTVLTSAFKFLKGYNHAQQEKKKNGVKKGGINGLNGFHRNSNSHHEQDNYETPFNATSSRSQKMKSKSYLTVYSSPYNSVRRTNVSTELPSYVKKMMESDASLRRLLKTGNVTISHIPHNGRESPETNSDEESTTSTKFAPHKSAGRTSSRGANLLKILAKKASTVEQSEEQTDISSKGDQIVTNDDLKITLTKVQRQNPSKPVSKKVHSKQKPMPALKSLPSLLKAERCSEAEEEEDERDFKKPERQEMEFDPTRFLEISFREEDNDEQRRKYKCPHCIKKFCWSTDLKRHILTHTGERPFSCDYCSANFTRKFLMQKHIRRHHSEKLDEPVASPAAPTVESDFVNGTVDVADIAMELDEVVKNEQEDFYEHGEDDNELGDDVEPEFEEPDASSATEIPDRDEELQPIIINVFSSVSDSRPMSNHNKGYSLSSVSKDVNKSILKQLAESKTGNAGQTGNLSMLVNS